LTPGLLHTTKCSTAEALNRCTECFQGSV